MENFKHFIVTRFNLRTSNNKWNKDKNINRTIDNSWMLYRINIFNQYCLPSVLNQSCENFTWIICLDIETDEKFRLFFHTLSQKYSFIVPLYIDGMQNLNSKYKEYIINQLGNEKYIITSRLDNDDILHRDYIKKIQEQFDFQKYQAVNFLKILMISPENKNKIHIDYSFSNHFISLIEEINENTFKGCYSKRDRHWNIKGEITQIIDKPYVAETIHDRNLLNQFRGFPVLKKMNLKAFAIEETYKTKILDKDNFKLHKMSWGKLAIYLKLCITISLQ